MKEINNKDYTRTDKFTNGQRLAYEKIMEFIDKPFDKKNFKVALIGAGGTGKSFLIKAIVNNCSIPYSEIGCAAPTHKACRIIRDSLNLNKLSVNTIASDLGKRVNYNNSKLNALSFENIGRVKMCDFKLYIIDEASMLERKTVSDIEKHAIDNCIKIIYVGDSYQLPPINEKYSTAFWKIPSYRLTEIVRQGENNPMSKLLEILRNDIKNRSFEFLSYIISNKSKFNDDSTKGYAVLNANTYENAVNEYFHNEELTKNIDFAKTIGYTNANISYWNKFIRHRIIKDSEYGLITNNDLITSYVNIVDENNASIIKNSEDYILKDVVNHYHPKYNLKGFMVRFQSVHTADITKPLFIVDHNDRQSWEGYCSKIVNLAEALNEKTITMKEYTKFIEEVLSLVDIRRRGDNKIIQARTLDYGFSLTSHKSQGSTFNNVFVDIDNIVYNDDGQVRDDIDTINRLLYVACSRAKDRLFLKYNGYGK